MKKVYLLRHAEKDVKGILTPQGEAATAGARSTMPHLAKVIASPSNRASLTAKLLTGAEPVIDERANFSMSSQDKSDAMNKIANERQVPFLEAVQIYNDPEVLAGVDRKADELNELIDELLAGLRDGESALIVSHDLSISPAMAKRGIPLESVDFLKGYVVSDLPDIQRF